MSEEWGPWIEHDGKGCPVVGRVVEVERFNAPNVIVVAGEWCRSTGEDVNGPRSAWVWENGTPAWTSVLRYRVRKPRGLTILESILADLPEKVDA